MFSVFIFLSPRIRVVLGLRGTVIPFSFDSVLTPTSENPRYKGQPKQSFPISDQLLLRRLWPDSHCFTLNGLSSRQPWTRC